MGLMNFFVVVVLKLTNKQKMKRSKIFFPKWTKTWALSWLKCIVFKNVEPDWVTIPEMKITCEYCIAPLLSRSFWLVGPTVLPPLPPHSPANETEPRSSCLNLCLTASGIHLSSSHRNSPLKSHRAVGACSPATTHTSLCFIKTEKQFYTRVLLLYFKFVTYFRMVAFERNRESCFKYRYHRDLKTFCKHFLAHHGPGFGWSRMLNGWPVDTMLPAGPRRGGQAAYNSWVVTVVKYTPHHRTSQASRRPPYQLCAISRNAVLARKLLTCTWDSVFKTIIWENSFP